MTMRSSRASGRPDVGEARIRAADRPKYFNRFESHTQHLSIMRTKMVASSPIRKSSVVDLVDLVMSRDHQNDNAVWLCRVTKKKVKQKRVRSRAHLNRRPLAPKSVVYHLCPCARSEKRPRNEVSFPLPGNSFFFCSNGEKT